MGKFCILYYYGRSKKVEILRLKYNFSVFYVVLVFLLNGFLTVSCDREKVESSVPEYSKPEYSVPDYSGTAALVLDSEAGEDIILFSYLNPVFQDAVVDFFGKLTGSLEVASVVLSNAVVYNVNPALAFALCYEESGYNPRAVNRNRNDTVDRGLFQLNNTSFPKLAVDDFFNPGISARYGLSHLRWCLNTMGTEVAALAMYNAGHNRVFCAGTPKSTLDYISRILKRQRNIEERFEAEYSRIAQTESLVAERKEIPLFRLSLLAPLGR